METLNETERLGLVHRAIAFGLALTTTSLIATSVAVIFTGSGSAFGHALARIALAPLRAFFGS